MEAARGGHLVSQPLPWQRAQAWWRKHNPRTPFAVLIANYLRGGHYLWNSPTEFILAASARWDGRRLRTGGEPNAWFIHLAASSVGIGLDIAAFLRLAPRPLPWVCWERRGVLRAFRWDSLVGRHSEAR